MKFLEAHQEEEIKAQTIIEINRIITENLDSNQNLTNNEKAKLEKWAADLTWRLKFCTSDEERFKVLIEQHAEFKKLNVFDSKNDSTGRALLLLSCMHDKIPPIIFEKSQEERYELAMENQDIEELCILTAEEKEKEKKRLAEYDEEYQIDVKLLKTLSDELEEAHSTFYQDEVLEDEYGQNRAFLDSVKTKRDQEQIKFKVRDYKEHCQDISKDRCAARTNRTRYDDYDEGRHL